MAKVKVIQKEGEEVPTEVLAKAIVQLDEAAQQMQRGPLKRKAIVVLLNDMSGVSRSKIEVILNCLTELRATYVKS